MKIRKEDTKTRGSEKGEIRKAENKNGKASEQLLSQGGHKDI